VTLDWTDADYVVDLRQTDHLPFRDGSQRFVYSSHLVEHLDDETIARLFAECRRILRPSGTIRIETPDAARFVEAYRRGDADFFGYFAASNRESHVVRLGLPETVLEPHNVLVGELSSYIEPGSGAHVYPLVERSEVDRRSSGGDLDAFGAWCVSLQTPEQYMSGGHINCLYFEKLERLLRAAGFTRIERKANRESSARRLVAGIERRHRAFYSVYVEASL
jgi:SAM-dependent methyltransferase